LWTPYFSQHQQEQEEEQPVHTILIVRAKMAREYMAIETELNRGQIDLFGVFVRSGHGSGQDGQ
jgi:hypothetical protein